MSNLALRVGAAVVGIPILLGAAILGGVWLMCVIIAIQFALLLEWRHFARAADVPLSSFAVAIAVAGINLFVFARTGNVEHGESLIAVYFWVLHVVFRRARKPLKQLGYGALFLVYAALPLALWYRIAELSDEIRHGVLGALGLLFIATWLCDSAAYFGGRAFGRRKLFPQASPNKTVEGAVSGIVGSALLLPAMKAAGVVNPTMLDFAVLPIIVGVAGQIGDLIESLMKREAGIKDSSQAIPGHGGFLDRFDSLLLSAPLFLAYLLITS